MDVWWIFTTSAPTATAAYVGFSTAKVERVEEDSSPRAPPLAPPLPPLDHFTTIFEPSSVDAAAGVETESVSVSSFPPNRCLTTLCSSVLDSFDEIGYQQY